MPFKKATPAERERMKLLRREHRQRSRATLGRDACLACMSVVACADGEPNSREVSFARAYLNESDPDGGVSRSVSAHAMAAVSESAMNERIRAFMSGGASSMLARRKLLSALFELAACDGPLGDDEEQVIERIARALHFPENRYATLARRWRVGASSARTAKEKRTTGANRPAIEPWCYEVLGCSESDSNETLKRSYRKLALQLHPDRHVRKDSSPLEEARIVKAFQRLQAAYAQIRKGRSL